MTAVDPAVGARLGTVLRAAGYGPDALRAATGADAWATSERVAPSPRDAPVILRRLRDDTPAATLLRLFLVGAAVADEVAAAALHPLTIDALAASNVVTRTSGAVRSLVRVGWCDDLLVVHDWDADGPPPADHVAAVAPASLTLANLTVRTAGVDALDLGTGCGVQAFLTAHDAGSVVGTDLNRRALDLAALGAALNGIDNVDWREGSLFDPVAGERFDLVTANPPFVISPDAAYMFRDGGGVGDAISRQVVAEAAAALRPDGWATVLCSWIERGEPEWSTPVARWLEGTGCDAWILRHRTDDPVTYAGVWCGQAGRLNEADLSTALDRWTSYYAGLSVTTIGTGAVIVHRPATGGGGRVWADEMGAGPDGPAGDQIRRAFAHRARRRHGDCTDDLLDTVVVPCDGMVLEQTLERRGGEYQPAGVSVGLRPGLGLKVDVEPEMLPIVLGFDGEQPTRRLIASAGLDPSSAGLLRTVDRILQLGIVAAGAGSS